MDSQPKSSGLVLGRRPLGAVLHSSNEPGELSEWLCHDDSIINIVLELLLLCEVNMTITFKKTFNKNVPQCISCSVVGDVIHCAEHVISP